MGFERESENFINVRPDDIHQKETHHKDQDDLASRFDPRNYTSSHNEITCVYQDQESLQLGEASLL